MHKLLSERSQTPKYINVCLHQCQFETKASEAIVIGIRIVAVSVHRCINWEGAQESLLVGWKTSFSG